LGVSLLLSFYQPVLSQFDSLSLHDALPICIAGYYPDCRFIFLTAFDNFEHIYAADKLDHSRYLLKTESDEVILDEVFSAIREIQDRKSTRLNSSHASISYAVCCMKKKSNRT